MTTHACNNGISACILEEAKALYKRISENKLSRGENRRALIACSIYTACKLNGVPRSIREIALMFQVETAAMTKACKQFQDLLKTNIMSSRQEDFLLRFGSKLDLGNDTVMLCQHVIRAAQDMCIVTESTPPSLVASVIALCCELRKISVSRKHIADVCQISQVTIAKCHKRLSEHSRELLPSADTATS